MRWETNSINFIVLRFILFILSTSLLFKNRQVSSFPHIFFETPQSAFYLPYLWLYLFICLQIERNTLLDKVPTQVASCTYKSHFIVLGLHGDAPVYTRRHDVIPGDHVLAEHQDGNVKFIKVVQAPVPVWTHYLQHLYGKLRLLCHTRWVWIIHIF